mgnify:FL=1
MTTLCPGVSEDRLHGGHVRLLQPLEGYRVAIDPVLLAASVPAKPGEEVLDLGCGVGAAALCLLARVPGCRVTGLELQAELVDLARGNAELNGVAEFFHAQTGDVLALPPAYSGRFDHVMLNPPFLPSGEATAAKDTSRAMAHLEGSASLDAWLGAALSCLKPKGSLTVIHRADRLEHVLAALMGKAGSLRVFPVWPRAGQPAKRVIVSARAKSRAPARLLPGLTLHGPESAFTEEAEGILRAAKPLDLEGAP